MAHFKSYLIAAIAIIAVILTPSCKSKKNIVAPIADQPGITPSTIVQHTIDAQPRFSTMNISKMTFAIQYGQYSFTFKGSIRVATDSLVSISIQPALGIEMYRIEFQNTGFAIYDKMNRRYSQSSYNYLALKTGINIDYHTVQSLFSHHLFTAQSSDPDTLKSLFDIQAIADTSIIKYNIPNSPYTHSFAIAPDYRIVQTAINNEIITIATITFDKRQRFDGISFPTNIALNSTIAPLTLKATLFIDKITFNQPLSTTPINISRYTKTSPTDILKFK